MLVSGMAAFLLRERGGSIGPSLGLKLQMFTFTQDVSDSFSARFDGKEAEHLK